MTIDATMRGLGVDVPTKIREPGCPVVITPKWTPKGVKYLRQWLLEKKRQHSLPGTP
jgi:hypothetical protein